MSQPRRRRRRRRRPGGGGQGQPAEQQRNQSQDRSKQQEQSSTRRRRRRGRRGRPQERQSSSPPSSEDLVRALPKERPETLSAPPDGQDLDQIIGELQSVWGVPQYPQEYRITIKIAEEREARGEQSVVVEEEGGDEGRAPGETGAPVREKAPAAPLMRSRSQNGGGPQREKAPRRRRRRRRGRGGGGNGGGGGQQPSS